MASKRKDKNRVVLKTGESYRKNDDRYSYRWTDYDGKRHTVYARTLDDLRAKEKEVDKSITDGLRADDSMTLNDIFEIWQEIRCELSSTTFQAHYYWYNRYVRESFGKRRIKSVRKSDVKKFYISLLDNGVRISGVRQVNKIVSQLFKIAVEDEYLKTNPTSGVFKSLNKMYPKEKRHALTNAESDLFAQYLSTDEACKRFYPLFTVLLYTGMRLGEALGLIWQDVDFEKNEISVNHTLCYFFHSVERNGGRVGTYQELHDTKTEAGIRVIPMLPAVRDALIFERKMQSELGIFCTTPVDGVSDFVFLNNGGCPHRPSSVRYHLKRIIESCNEHQREVGSDLYLPHFSCHILRHTFATRLCERGVNVKVVQDVMGHSNVSVTLDIYTDVTAELKKKSFDELSESMTPI